MVTRLELERGNYAVNWANLGFPRMKDDFCRGDHFFTIDDCVYDWTSLELRINDAGLDRLYRRLAITRVYGLPVPTTRGCFV